MTAPRSYLFVPGDRPDMLAKAATRGAGAVIADLEDAVAPDRRDHARTSVAEWIEGNAGPERWVRVNNEAGALESDLAAVARPGLTGVFVPKVSSPDEIACIAESLVAAERVAGIAPGRFGVIPIIETAAAVLAAGGIAAAARVRRLMIGELDLGAQIGVDPRDAAPWTPVRMQVVLASAAAGLPGPIGPVSPDFTDLGRIEEQSRGLYRMGFRARPAIHPAQVPAYERAFRPSPEEVERARRVIELYEQALADGRGAARDDDGHMIDEASVKVAKAVFDAG